MGREEENSGKTSVRSNSCSRNPARNGLGWKGLGGHSSYNHHEPAWRWSRVRTSPLRPQAGGEEGQEDPRDSIDLIHAVGYGADDGLVPEVLVEAVNVDLPVDAVVRRRLGTGKKAWNGGKEGWSGGKGPTLHPADDIAPCPGYLSASSILLLLLSLVLPILLLTRASPLPFPCQRSWSWLFPTHPCGIRAAEQNRGASHLRG